MGYMKAEEILPVEIIELIQQYVDGTNLYIPRKEKQRAGWGTSNDAKIRLRERNKMIYQEYQSGVSVDALANKYFLSDKSIWRILRDMRITA